MVQKHTVPGLAVVLTLVFFCSLQSLAVAGEFTPAEMKKMGVFLSNFTELGLYNVDHRDFLDPLHPEMAIRFGIWHNYVNNFKTRITHCKANCPYGSLLIEGRYVAESVEKYLGFGLGKHKSVRSDYITAHYDGKSYHFEGADGEVNPYVRVREARTASAGVIQVRGELYNPEAPSENMGTFSAEITPATWRGKATWNLLNLDCQLK
ncbi:MAG: hypothetical protein IJU37_01270 [Desulfovibrio sp.]|nr:hypothetical protein [Desulfovibrio sp.]